MNERIKKLRKTLGLTQKGFGERIGIKPNTVATYEIGRNEPIDAVISLICREFNVNETWLRTGDGEMFIRKARNDEIADFVNDILHGEPDFRQKFISVLSRMSPEEWALLEKKVLELAAEVKPTDLEREADEFAALAREQYLSEKKPDAPVSSVKESGAI